MAVERSDTSDEDAEKATEQQAVEQRLPADQPGTEPPGLSRTDSRAAAEAANGGTTQATADVIDEVDASPSPEAMASGQDSDLVETEKDDERDAVDDIGDEQPGAPDVQEAPCSAWDAPEIRDHPQRPEAKEIRFTDDRRAHTLDGDNRGGGHRYGTGRSGKTEFPADWDDDTTVAHILDVAHRPDTAEFQRRGTWKVQGERDGVEVNVAIKPDGRIWTAFPSPGGNDVIENPREG